MSLKTKSIMAKLSEEDGLRICVMRLIRPFYKFDDWWKELSPPLDLLMDYRNSRINWEEYVLRFEKEVVIPYKERIKFLSDIAMERDVTLLCIEKTPEYCHRRILAEECKRYNSDLELNIE